MSFSKVSALAGVLSLAASVSAHGHVRGINVGGQFTGGFELAYAYTNTPPDVIGWTTTALDNGFVEPAKFGTSDIACHLGGKAGKAFATVAAGSKVDVIWDTWPESHHGPVLDYLAPFSEDAGSLNFFKFAEAGVTDGSAAPNKWASDTINAANNFTWTVTIPSDIAPGKYVYRHEIIALHSSGDPNGAQAYPQCLNLEITGSGTVTPAGIPASQFYTSTDPGILVSIYAALGTSYVIPGPAVYSGSGSSPAPAPTPVPSTTTPSTPAEITAPEVSETAAPAPTETPYETEPAPTAAPTSSKSKSACRPKSTKALPVSEPTGAPTPAATEEPSAPTPTAEPTPEEPTPAEPTNPEPTTPSEPTTPEVPAATLPEGTKLSSVLGWLSGFYAKYGDGEYTSETALRRRHARSMRF